MSQNYANINIRFGGKSENIKIQKGIVFENNGAKYFVDNDGKLHKFDKTTSAWSQVKSINMTVYQKKIFDAIMDNNDETKSFFGHRQFDSNKELKKGEKAFSFGDLFASREMSDRNFKKDLMESLPDGYKVERHRSIVKPLDIDVDVTYEEAENIGGRLTFSFDPTLDKVVNKSENSSKKSTVKLPKHDYNSRYVTYDEPRVYTVTEDEVTFMRVANREGVSSYRLELVNPQYDWSKTWDPSHFQTKMNVDKFHKGDRINIPGRYKIKSGTVKTRADVAAATGLSESYIEEIIEKIEQYRGTTYPDAGGTPIKDKKGRIIGYKDAKGTPTIGFGHTGYVDGKPLSCKKPIAISRAKAYELLAQDILDAKYDAIEYFGEKNFNKISPSVQAGIVDLVFWRGIYDGIELIPNSPTNDLKKLLENRHPDEVEVCLALDKRLGNGNSKKGLCKRNYYRILMATTDLSQKERDKVLKGLKPDYDYLKSVCKPSEFGKIDTAYSNAKSGKTSGFVF